jgi:hypothetical protein
MAERGVQQPEKVGGKDGVGGSGFWHRPLRELQAVLLNQWFQFIIIMLAVVAHTWLPGWWVGHFPDITQPLEFSSKDESRITDYFLDKCPGAECEKSQHVEFQQIADGLVSMVREDVFYAEHPDVANEMKDVYKDRYVTYIVYEFFDLTVRPCFDQLQASFEAVDRPPGTRTSDALDDLAQTKPNCAFLKTSLSRLSNETLRSNRIQAYAVSFSRIKDELALRLAADIFHRSADALDQLSKWVSTLPNEGISEQEIANAKSNIRAAGQLIEVQTQLREFIENTMYHEQREEQKRRLESATLYVLFALILVFSPALPEICNKLLHIFGALPHGP